MPARLLTETAQARVRIESAQAIAVLTGAGTSTESGALAFRGAGGLRRNFRARISLRGKTGWLLPQILGQTS